MTDSTEEKRTVNFDVVFINPKSKTSACEICTPEHILKNPKTKTELEINYAHARIKKRDKWTYYCHDCYLKYF
ncbi:MAG: hypothetical protein ACW99Q_15130 [Candidatus Kariarchaeaceae archaeon]|jgi:hypothetical protein